MKEGERVLVVDDERLIRWSVSEHLARLGFQTDTAETGEEALAKLAVTPPSLVLLDVRLPGIDGLETLTKALALRSDLTIIMMSAHSTIDQAVLAMKNGATDFLVKPFAFQALDVAVARSLEAARTRREIAEQVVGRHGEQDALEAVIGESPAMQRLRAMIPRVAATEATVLISGESGSGKEVIARAIHRASPRAEMPFLQVNCAALPDQLVESELFGHERGAFTDARTQKKGLFESAGTGTVFLDEIGDLPLSGQAKLLQLLESRSFRRVGGVTEFKTEARVLAATNVHLEERVSDGRFRSDLFFRLNVVRIQVPPLRERREDIAPLAGTFIARYDRERDRQVRGLSAAAIDLLRSYEWPGNVRELRNAVERALILHPEIDELRPEHFELTPGVPAAAPPTPLPSAVVTAGEPNLDLEVMERKLIAEALEQCSGNQSRAAKLLGISRDALRYRMKRHGLT